jgi:hypothetical protein
MDDQAVIDATRRWVDSFVIGLNLCPFAKRVADGGRIRYAVSAAITPVAFTDDLRRELELLTTTSRTEIETTLLILPHALPDYLDFNDFLDTADGVLSDLRLQGVVQLVGFHPDYYFADTPPDAVDNYTNRSPYPMLHLLREDSISEVSNDPEALEAIPKRNVELLRRMGLAAVRKRLREMSLPRPDGLG